MDSEKTLEGLDCCTGTAVHLGHCPEGCPYFAESERADKCFEKLHHDALELLKCHTPSIISVSDLINKHKAVKDGCVWFEVKYGFLAPAFVDIFHRNEIRIYSPFLHPGSDEESNETWWGIDCYGAVWRCWTFRPTDKQREETPWT